jgi:mannonate dehydratase
MKRTWRWFGPKDTVSVDDMLQCSVQGVVSALHHVAPGRVWTAEEIALRQTQVATRADGTASGIAWDVVECLPVSEDIKKQKGEWRAHLDAYRASMRNLAGAGIEVVCYNFMPVLDWTRTDLAWARPTGATCMRFDLTDFAAFDIHILKRPGAAEDFPEGVVEAAGRRAAGMDDAAKDRLAKNLVFGLPGSLEGVTLDDVRRHLAEYDGIPPGMLRQHLVDFLSEIIPLAEELGLRFCCHPDDPPFPLLGLPRVMSTEADYRAVLDAVPSPSNGVTLCAGSLGSRPDNDLPGMMRRLGDKVHFLHLRNVTRDDPEAAVGSFFEDEHLEGGTDMVALITEVLAEEKRRRDAGRADWSLPFRPDHGQDILDDKGRRSQPGYPLIGRMKGLAELRGIIAGVSGRMRG